MNPQYSRTSGLLLILFPFIVALSACNNPGGAFIPAPPTSGKYSGLLIQKNSQTSFQRTLDAQLSSPAIGANTYQFDLVLADGTRPGPVTLSLQTDGSVLLSAEFLIAGLQTLLPVAESCYTGASSVKLCWNSNEISIHGGSGSDRDSFALVMDLNLSDSQVSSEAKIYSIEDLVQTAMDQSFTSQIAMDNALVSKDNAAEAHGNLYPHFTVNDIFSLMSFNYLTLVKSVGNLAPFLLPTRWITADGARHQADADLDAYRVARADAANIAEGLGLNYLRDVQAYQSLESFGGSLNDILHDLESREKFGTADPGAADAVRTVVQSLAKMTQGLNRVLQSEKTSLASALGLTNPQGVLEVLLPAAHAVDHPSVENVETLKALILTRSVELKEMDELIKVAQDNSDSRMYYFIDPSVGNGVGLGGGTAPFLQAGRDQLTEIQVQRAQLRSILEGHVQTASISLSANLEAYQTAMDNLEIQQRRLTRLQNEIRFGNDVAPSELESALQDVLLADQDRLNAVFGYDVANANMDRLLFAGHYSRALDAAP